MKRRHKRRRKRSTPWVRTWVSENTIAVAECPTCGRFNIKRRLDGALYSRLCPHRGACPEGRQRWRGDICRICSRRKRQPPQPAAPKACQVVLIDRLGRRLMCAIAGKSQREASKQREEVETTNTPYRFTGQGSLAELLPVEASSSCGDPGGSRQMLTMAFAVSGIARIAA